MGFYGTYKDGKEKIEHFKASEFSWSNPPVYYKLQNCPKCGATQKDQRIASVFFGFKVGADGWTTHCKNCGYETGFYRTEKESVDKWNEGE